jgi:glycerol-3-phosphate dehydrogenase
MAEDAVDRAEQLAHLEERHCVTRDLHIHGYHPNAEQFGILSGYGSDAPAVSRLICSDSRYTERLHPEYPIQAGEVVWAVRYEMARTIEDVLSRRTRLLPLDARASMQVAPAVARLMDGELGRDAAWEEAQVEAYRSMAQGYFVGSSTGGLGGARQPLFTPAGEANS